MGRGFPRRATDYVPTAVKRSTANDAASVREPKFSPLSRDRPPLPPAASVSRLGFLVRWVPSSRGTERPIPLSGSDAPLVREARASGGGRAPTGADDYGSEEAEGGRRRPAVALVAAVLVVAVGAASALAVRAYVLDEGIIGLPPVGATPSTPKSGELVFSFTFAHTGGDPGRFHVSVYADGRLISERIGHPSLAPTDEHRNSTGIL